MTLGMNIILAAITVIALARSMTLTLRYLQDGIAYLRHGRIVLDVAMPLQGAGVGVLAVATTVCVITVDPAYPAGAGIMLLSVLGASGALGLLNGVMFAMSLSDMRHRAEYGQPLFLRDRTPGARSTRRIPVYPLGE